jgi:NAD(P)-dependent dehydrogenase (short-subunit alcohol dehydrogenase family)
VTSLYLDAEETKRHDQLKFDFNKRPLAGRVVLLAGGTGGLGLATAALLITEGAFPILGFRSDRPRAEYAQQKLQDLYGGPVGIAQGDILTEEGRTAWLKAALAAKNRIDGLVVLTGDPARSRTADLAPDVFARALHVNLAAPLLLARDTAASMVSTHTKGSIVLLSSMQGSHPFENSLAYGTSKAGLGHGARVLAKEFGGKAGISVNVVAPGVTTAGMARASVDSGKYDPMIQRGVIPRFGRPEDVARAIRALLDPGLYITGQILVVDGGLTLRRDLG